MSRTTIIRTILITVTLLLTALPAAAGGWAVITIDSLPEEVRAGNTVHLEFTVLQHGEKPIHTVDFLNNEPLIPTLMARNAESGETIEVNAQPAEEVGRFTIDVVFPTEGTWEWEITPNPLEGALQLQPLTVLAATPAGAAVAEPPRQVKEEAGITPSTSQPAEAVPAPGALRWIAPSLLLAAVLGTLLVFGRRHYLLGVTRSRSQAPR